MSSEPEKSLREDGLVENPAVQQSSVTLLHGKKSGFTAALPALDAEYHSAGFCACCMRGE